MGQLLGASPLGLSFFSEYKYGNSFLGKYVPFTKPQEPNIQDLKNARSSTGDSESDQKLFEREYGIGYRSFGDIKSRFTNNSEKNPSTFYAYNDFDAKAEQNQNTIFEYIKSKGNSYYNSDYVDQYSSISKIVEQMKKMSTNTPEGSVDDKSPALMLKADDFAYLKKLGVYPTNRLVLARRFDYPIGDDLLSSNLSPTAVIPSWIEDGKSFIDITYGEEWSSVMSVDMAAPAGKGFAEYGYSEEEVQKKLSEGLGVTTLTGFTDYLQYYFFNEAGLTDRNNLAILPMGNPNIIRSAKMRKMPTPGTDFEGLSYAFNITIDTEYEIKYIDGVDPTLAYFDIISNLLRFGTSESQFQFDARFNTRAREIIDNLSSGDSKKVLQEVIKIAGSFIDSAGNIMKTAFDAIFSILGIKSSSLKLTDVIVSAQVKKYRLKFLGIINALTGSPSGIYHVTIGNPFRPLFSSGDLYTGEAKNKIILGPELGYNNLPTTIKFTTQLRNARACGLQEIYKKFSPRSIRQSVRDPGSWASQATNDRQVILSSRVNRIRPQTRAT
jgi:hypothetical protein